MYCLFSKLLKFKVLEIISSHFLHLTFLLLNKKQKL
jgi:hypothetical protein